MSIATTCTPSRQAWVRMPTWLFGSLRGYQRSWLSGDVVAGKIDQHHVLGDFLLIESQVSLHPAVSVVVDSAVGGKSSTSRSRNRPNRHPGR